MIEATDEDNLVYLEPQETADEADVDADSVQNIAKRTKVAQEL